jgi:hypothetical protein
MSDRGAFQMLVAIAAGVAIAVSACRSPQDRGPHRGSRDGVEGRVEAERATVAAPATAASADPPQGAGASPPHGDHNPHHGGVVLMNGDLHYEVVLDPAGRSHRLFFSDAVREDLPASIASSVALTIFRPGATDELIPLQIDGTGESWTGSGRVVADPAKTTVRVTFTIRGEPYWIDVPFGVNK